MYCKESLIVVEVSIENAVMSIEGQLIVFAYLADLFVSIQNVSLSVHLTAVEKTCRCFVFPQLQKKKKKKETH